MGMRINRSLGQKSYFDVRSAVTAVGVLLNFAYTLETTCSELR